METLRKSIEEAFEKAGQLRNEFVIAVTGITVQFICNKTSIKEKDKNKLNKKGA